MNQFNRARWLLRRTIVGSLAGLWVGLAMGLVVGQTPDVQVNLSATNVRVAEPVTVEWTLIVPEGTTVSFPEIPARWQDWDVIDSNDELGWLREPSSNGRIWRRRLTLESLTSGMLMIPAMEISVAAGERLTTLRAPEKSIRVTSVLEGEADPTQFRDIRGVRDAPAEMDAFWRRQRWWIGGGLGMILICGLALVWYRRRQRLSPLGWVRDEWVQLAAATENASPGRAEWESLDATLRRFLTWQFAVGVLPLTPDEVVESLEDRFRNEAAQSSWTGPDHWSGRLRSLLQRAEQAKFAGWRASAAEWQTALADGKELIEWAGHLKLGPAFGPREGL